LLRIWLAMFKALTGSTGVVGTASIDSSHVKAHRSAAGGKGRKDAPFFRRDLKSTGGARRRSSPLRQVERAV
jgi:hypothetical protein